MKKKSINFICLVLALCLAAALFTGCGESTESESPASPKEEAAAEESPAVSPEESTAPEVSDEAGETGTETESPAPSEVETEAEGSGAEAENEAPQESGSQALLYIGTAKRGFKEYPAELEGEISAEKLIAAVSQLTGWDLSLSDEVFSGAGGMTVSFASGCSLFTGPPENQKEEFTVLDNYSLAEMILDSIQETLRRNFVMSPGDPESLDIWYCAEDKPIEIEGLTVSMEKPWDEQDIF